MPGSLLLIAVVWIVLLTPLVLFNRRPVRQTSEALTETRLVHSGGAELRKKRKLRPSPALYTVDDSDEELELVDAEPEYVLLDDEGTESSQRTPGKSVAVARQDGHAVETVGAQGDEADGDAETRPVIDGEVIEEVRGDAVADDSANEDVAKNAPAGDTKTDDDTANDGSVAVAEYGVARKADASSYKSHDETDTGEFGPIAEEDVVAALQRKKTAKSNREAEKKVRKADTSAGRVGGVRDEADTTDAGNTGEAHEGVEAILPQPVEVPAGVLRGVDFDDERGRDDHVRELATVGTARPVEKLYDSMELSEDDINYIASRRGRGVFDPVASAAANRRRQQRRKHVLLGMVALLVLTLALAFWRGGALWLLPVVMTAMTAFYLIALRKNAIEEAKLRRRRLARMRRARLGVRNTEDQELGVIPARLMRPGAVIVEPDEADAELHNLAVVDSHDFFFNGDEERDYYNGHIRAV
ncbi:divisome protein SepX/GlpR [Corynebacterium auriscanis]